MYITQLFGQSCDNVFVCILPSPKRELMAALLSKSESELRPAVSEALGHDKELMTAFEE